MTELLDVVRTGLMTGSGAFVGFMAGVMYLVYTDANARIEWEPTATRFDRLRVYWIYARTEYKLSELPYSVLKVIAIGFVAGVILHIFAVGLWAVIHG